MQGDKTILKRLNRQLTFELTAINQYFLHARIYQNWGLAALGKHEYSASIQEMKQADRLIERILFLEGLPNLQNLDKLLIGENVPECLEGDLAQERMAQSHLKETICACEQAEDFVSREILEAILEQTEAQIDYFETQLELVRTVGIQNYLQAQIHHQAD